MIKVKIFGEYRLQEQYRKDKQDMINSQNIWGAQTERAVQKEANMI